MIVIKNTVAAHLTYIWHGTSLFDMHYKGTCTVNIYITYLWKNGYLEITHKVHNRSSRWHVAIIKSDYVNITKLTFKPKQFSRPAMFMFLSEIMQDDANS